VLVLEDVGPQTMPPWTPAKWKDAARSYAAFHANTYGKPLPRWLSRIEHRDFAPFWDRLASTGELRGTASLARRRADEAEEWLDVALPVLRENAARLLRLRPPFAFMHFDTRSDNIRLQGKLLRIFDWNFACAGPIEFDVAAFAQAIAMEGGPDPERVVAEYDLVLPLRPVALDAAIAGIAGYFADRAWRPATTGLPRSGGSSRRPSPGPRGISISPSHAGSPRSRTSACRSGQSCASCRSASPRRSSARRSWPFASAIRSSFAR
jgi:Ser/Thr protein kinase RdoA (MazF antagonist)